MSVLIDDLDEDNGGPVNEVGNCLLISHNEDANR